MGVCGWGCVGGGGGERKRKGRGEEVGEGARHDEMGRGQNGARGWGQEGYASESGYRLYGLHRKLGNKTFNKLK